LARDGDLAFRLLDEAGICEVVFPAGGGPQLSPVEWLESELNAGEITGEEISARRRRRAFALAERHALASETNRLNRWARGPRNAFR
jgi:hypothetical protein